MNDTTHTPADQQSRVRALLDDAAAHYRATLREAPRAVAYLRKRGITGAGAARYGIGFAAPGWHELDAILAQHDLATIEASGLQVFKDGEQPRRFDRFRDRIMFPIRDVSGQIRGFGGRILVESDTAPKYMNSPEGPTFKKRELLYGLYEAQAAIEAEDMALVVEGYLDVVSLAQAGFLPVVGSLGTACTADQIGALLTRDPPGVLVRR
ncbi:toprim domain-containing protein (plasmid) [Ralstonia insidiosa]|nr:toprim domain-containing protein [Ralstonia insidiosa]